MAADLAAIPARVDPAPQQPLPDASSAAGAADPALAAAADVAALRTQFQQGKTALLERFRSSRPTAPAASRLIRSLCRHVDSTLLQLWDHAAMPAGAALLAEIARAHV